MFKGKFVPDSQVSFVLADLEVKASFKSEVKLSDCNLCHIYKCILVSSTLIPEKIEFIRRRILFISTLGVCSLKTP